MTTVRKPPKPQGLGTKASRIWRSITSDFELTAVEYRVLEDLCREVDLVERIAKEVSKSSLVVEGSMGQPVANELVKEIRQHRALVAQLGKALNLPQEDDGSAAASRSASARELARARWGT